MLLPLNQKSEQAIKLPYITFLIIIITVTIQVIFFLNFEKGRKISEQSLKEALELYVKSPYLKISPKLEAKLFEGYTKDQEDAFRELLAFEKIKKPSDQSVINIKQAELDKVIALANNEDGQNPFQDWGVVPSDLIPITLITHIGFHIGWLHIILNLILFYLSASFLEDIFGGVIVLLIFLLAGIFSSSIGAFQNAKLDISLIGTTGSLAGIMGVFFVRLIKSKMSFAYWIAPFLKGNFYIPGSVIFIGYLICQFFVLKIMTTAYPNVDINVFYYIPIWGLVFGLSIGMLIKYLSLEQKYFNPVIESELMTQVVENNMLKQVMYYRKHGQNDAAHEVLKKELKKNPKNIDALITHWELCVDIHQPDIALTSLVRLINIHIKENKPSIVVKYWLELLERFPSVRIDANMAIKISEILIKNNREYEAEVTLKRAYRFLDKQAPTGILMKFARLACELRSDLAPAACRKAYAHPEMPLEAKEELMGMFNVLNVGH